jgi:hypothetical protein
MKDFKSKYNYFWIFLLFLIFISISFNIKNIISFNTLFLVLIPNWLFTFILFRLEVNNIKKELFKIFKDNINNLFTNEELKNNEEIIFFKEKYNKIASLFIYVSAISIMSFLLSSVFIMMKYASNTNLHNDYNFKTNYKIYV